MSTRKFLKLPFLAVLFSAAAMAADRSDWTQLASLVRGDTIRIETTAKRVVRGRFQSCTPDRLTIINDADKPYDAERGSVLRVKRTKNGGRVRRAAIGAGLGFGAGFAIGAAASGPCSSSPQHWCVGPRIGRAEVGAMVGGVGMLVGGFVGALIPGHNTELIYEVRRSRP